MKSLIKMSILPLLVCLSLNGKALAHSYPPLSCNEVNYKSYIWSSEETQKLISETGKGCNLRGADFYQANLTGADLTEADLTGADLRGAILIGADLRGANLSGAYLYWAYLTGAYLYWADLQGANVTWADLQGANIL